MSAQPSDAGDYKAQQQELKQVQQTALREQLETLKQTRDRLAELLSRVEDTGDVTRIAEVLVQTADAEREAIRLVSELRYMWPAMAIGAGEDAVESGFIDVPVYCSECDAYFEGVNGCPAHKSGSQHGEQPSEWRGHSE